MTYDVIYSSVMRNTTENEDCEVKITKHYTELREALLNCSKELQGIIEDDKSMIYNYYCCGNNQNKDNILYISFTKIDKKYNNCVRDVSICICSIE